VCVCVCLCVAVVVGKHERAIGTEAKRRVERRKVSSRTLMQDR